MNQLSFIDMEYSLWKRTTKREEFLDILDEIIPWNEWVDTEGHRENAADVSAAMLD